MSVCKVVPTQSATGAAAAAGQCTHGFAIRDHRGLPLVTIQYTEENEARRAEETVREALEPAIGVTSP